MSQFENSPDYQRRTVAILELLYSCAERAWSIDEIYAELKLNHPDLPGGAIFALHACGLVEVVHRATDTPGQTVICFAIPSTRPFPFQRFAAMDDMVRIAPAKPWVRRCRACGCTDDDCTQCIQATGKPCHWVAPNLCSRCHDQRLTNPSSLSAPAP